MGFRFRKSVSIIPGVRLNFGKKSVGVSVGNKYGGVTYNSKNGTTYRVSAPGTGASVTHTEHRAQNAAPQSSGAASSSPPPATSKKPWIVLAVMIALAVYGVAGGLEGETAEPAPTPTATIEPAPVRAMPAPVESFAPADLAPFVAAENSNIYHVSDCSALSGKDANNFAQFLTAEAAARAGFSPHSECMAADAPTPAPGPSHAFVASSLSDKYHIKGCRYADQIDAENIIYFESNAKAENRGYEPCGYCMG